MYVMGCPRPHVRNVCLGSRNTHAAGEKESTLGSFAIWVGSNLAKTALLLFLQGSFSQHHLLMLISQGCAVMQNTCDP